MLLLTMNSRIFRLLQIDFRVNNDLACFIKNSDEYEIRKSKTLDEVSSAAQGLS